MDRNTYALKNFIGIMKSCRRQLIEDAINGNTDLFKFLYEDKNPALKELYEKRYELKWLESHLLKCRDLLTDAAAPLATKRELLRIFLQWYQNFVAAWGYSSTDAFFFSTEIESLDVLIETNRNWEAEFEKLQLSFLRETKILDKQILEAETL